MSRYEAAAATALTRSTPAAASPATTRASGSAHGPWYGNGGPDAVGRHHHHDDDADRGAYIQHVQDGHQAKGLHRGVENLPTEQGCGAARPAEHGHQIVERPGQRGKRRARRMRSIHTMAPTTSGEDQHRPQDQPPVVW